jgi:CubicO group peptidase (beta-lactamase class C family)
MTADHLGPEVRIGTFPACARPRLRPWFAVRGEWRRRRDGGRILWGGIAGTAFWIAPQEELIALMMIQAPGQRDYYRQLFRFLMHAALA